MTTNPIKKARLSAAVALVAGLSLALTACGGTDAQNGKGGTGGSDTSQSQPSAGADQSPSEPAEPTTVYDFENAKVESSSDQMPFAAMDQPFVVRLSEELAGAIPDGQSMAVEKYIVTPKSFGTGMCRADVAVTYGDGGLESVKATTPGDKERESTEAAILYNLTGKSPTVVPVDALPSDDDLVEDQAYVTSDGSGFTIVEECSEDDSETFVGLHFPYVDRGERSSEQSYARASVTVLRSGSSTVTGDTEADLSVSGNWTKPTD
ncbi:hypothetical protein [Rothia halotolerans]|uniref:hypothetical protein n=1 Tax=Rothia halotolerans TaxID=405770 RepID=UPI0018743D11|nr:hypothetical protein [Rothia halotolerans]